jgi:hypothetical protein
MVFSGEEFYYTAEIAGRIVLTHAQNRGGVMHATFINTVEFILRKTKSKIGTFTKRKGKRQSCTCA